MSHMRHCIVGQGVSLVAIQSVVWCSASPQPSHVSARWPMVAVLANCDVDKCRFMVYNMVSFSSGSMYLG